MRAATATPRLIHVGHVAPDPHWGLRAHAHAAHHELIVVVRGRMQVAWPGGSLAAAPGDVLLYPSGVLHHEQSDPHDPVETIFLAFASPLRADGVVRIEDGRGRIRQAVRWLLEDRLAPDATPADATTALLRLVLAEFARQQTRVEAALVTQTRQWVRERLASPVTLGQLAAAAGLSRFHFVRAYRRACGLTPMRDVRRLRLAYARDLVGGTGLPLKDIARRAGLGNPQALSRAFRQAFGAPPGALRREGGWPATRGGAGS